MEGGVHAGGDTATGGTATKGGNATLQLASSVAALLQEMAPFLPAVATQLLPSISERLLSRITARAVRELYV